MIIILLFEFWLIEFFFFGVKMLLKLFQSVILTAFILFGFFRSSLTITNSSEVDISQAPWTVGIVTNPSKDTEFCAGSILSSTFVVTAAQCVYG